MDKIDLFNEVREQMASGVISREEVLSLLGEGQQDLGQSIKNIKVSQILSYVGAFIIFLGIVVLVIQFWDSMSVLTRILVTLGSGVVAYCLGSVFGLYEKMYQASQAFYLLSGFLLPVGLAVVFDEYGAFDPLFIQMTIAGVLFVLYLVSFLVAKRKDIFVIFSILFGTWFIYATAVYMLEMASYKYYAYLTLCVGIAYILLGYRMKTTPWDRLTSWLYSFGVLGILISTISLGGVWDVLFAGVVLGVMFLSIYLTSRSFLVFGTLFIMIYIGKLTGQYFADVTGWPVALIIAGLALIGVGYGAFYLNEKYFPKLS